MLEKSILADKYEKEIKTMSDTFIVNDFFRNISFSHSPLFPFSYYICQNTFLQHDYMLLLYQKKI